jgi:hypothetical protein
MKAATLGSAFTILATAFWCSTKDSKEIPSTASVVTSIWDVSSEGMNPLGKMRKRWIVARRTRIVKSNVIKRCFKNHLSPLPYTLSIHSKAFSDFAWKPPGSALVSYLRKRLLSMGVRVREMKRK